MKILIPLLLISQFSFAQTSLIKQWDNRFGGTNADHLTSIIKIDDGFLISGWSDSDSSGDKTQNNWRDLNNGIRNDFWCVRIDENGNKIWDKRYGGSLDETSPIAVFNSFENGFLIAGTSFSDSSGDKSQDSWHDSIYQTRDFWAISIDANGNKNWDKRFGGIGDEYVSSVVKTANGNYLLAGYSNSDSSGDKSQNNQSFGYVDFWVILINSLGDKIWDKRFGGTEHDVLTSSIQTNDGGFLLGGYSRSDNGGDKSQPIWGVIGIPDYWIVKIDGNGNKQWDKSYGGTDEDKLFSILQTNDGGYVLGGSSDSDSSGDKSQNGWGYPVPYAYDYWIVRIDSLGNKLWDRRFGGVSPEDEFGNIALSGDGNIYVCGTSYSAITGDKSEINLGEEQTWILKIDLSGNKIWDKTIFTSGHEEFAQIIPVDSNCFLVGVETAADIGGYKTQDSRGDYDYWLIKFCDTTRAVSEVDEVSLGADISIYPNPSSGNLIVELLNSLMADDVSIGVVNTLGQKVFSSHEKISSSDWKKEIDLHEAANGIYFIEIKSPGVFLRKKVIVAK